VSHDQRIQILQECSRASDVPGSGAPTKANSLGSRAIVISTKV
jgi:hypothetical protein